ncbi:hypothetical protein BJ912DRAFT_1071173 [Pholiota molesta]|nr:hypothetical protein BJ912DRAFT_1071173 [Pholiota molesta]
MSTTLRLRSLLRFTIILSCWLQAQHSALAAENVTVLDTDPSIVYQPPDLWYATRLRFMKQYIHPPPPTQTMVPRAQQAFFNRFEYAPQRRQHQLPIPTAINPPPVGRAIDVRSSGEFFQG